MLTASDLVVSCNNVFYALAIITRQRALSFSVRPIVALQDFLFQPSVQSFTLLMVYSVVIFSAATRNEIHLLAASISHFLTGSVCRMLL